MYGQASDVLFQKGKAMSSVVFLVLAIVMAFLGFSGTMGGDAAGIGRFLFFDVAETLQRE